MLSRFLTTNMLERDGELTMQFVHSIVETRHAASYFLGADTPANDANLLEFFEHVAHMPDVIRANVYARSGRIIWSSDAQLTGRQFDRNDELDQALTGKLVVKSAVVGSDEHHKQDKAEHAFLASERFVENYIPVRNPENSAVIGAIEFYRMPRALFQAIEQGTKLIWLCGAIAGLLLFATLFWAVRRADNIMRGQEERLVESETLAAVGEMAVAIAHGIRNPLAVIRSTAELNATTGGDENQSSQDIIAQVDRLERWLRDLLTYSQPESGQLEPVALDAVLAQSLRTFARDIEKHAITLELDVAATLPRVRGDIVLLTQLFHSLFANALEAVADGGHISVRAQQVSAGAFVQLHITDDGSGIEPAQMARLFEPFHTSKPKGLGVGLPLVRRIVKRFGGLIHIDSTAGVGTTVILDLAVAD